MEQICQKNEGFQNLYLYHGMITQGISSLFSVSKISLIYLMTPIDSTNDQNNMRRVI